MNDDKKPLAGAMRAAHFLEPVLSGMAEKGNTAAAALLDGNGVAIERESGLGQLVEAVDHLRAVMGQGALNDDPGDLRFSRACERVDGCLSAVRKP